MRRLKEEGKPKGEITEAVAKLKEYKKKLEDGVFFKILYAAIIIKLHIQLVVLHYYSAR